MFKLMREQLIKKLFDVYRMHSLDMQTIETALKQKNIFHLVLDHFAVIDLPSAHSGISPLSQLFIALGFVEQGKGYLVDKQNDFLWLCESMCAESPAEQALPQVVVADFRLDEMPLEIKKIIEKYTRQIKPDSLSKIFHLIERVAAKEIIDVSSCINQLIQYFITPQWHTPTVHEFHTVREFNELLAWVLVFGRRPNHFTLSIHLLKAFENLDDFHQFIATHVKLPLNQEGGIIKGGPLAGIAQSSTLGMIQHIALADGNVAIPTGFIEFVWRYPLDSQKTPSCWRDYYTGFIPQHADRVIESLYIGNEGL